jgi:hypothetical protein
MVLTVYATETAALPWGVALVVWSWVVQRTSFRSRTNVA